MSFMAVEDLLIGFSPAAVDGSCPFVGLSMPLTEGDLVLIGGGGSGGCFAVWRLDMVGSEGIKLVCNGENGRRTETQSGISIRRIVLLRALKCSEEQTEVWHGDLKLGD
jgi:hypothetical protein